MAIKDVSLNEHIAYRLYPARSRHCENNVSLYFMNFLARRSLVWVMLNLVGMVTFLRLAAEIWVLPGEKGLPGGPGDPFYWILILVPWQLIFLALNLCALYVIVKHRSEPRKKIRICLWIAVAILWVIVVLYDHHRGFREISPLNALSLTSQQAQV